MSADEVFQDTISSKSNILVSIDLNSIKPEFASSVSNPSGGAGLTAEEILEICFISGKSSNVRGVLINEYNPTLEMHKTADLVT